MTASIADQAHRAYDSILDLLPSPENPTPIVRLRRLLGPSLSSFSLYGKLEWMNPFGSVKDRAAAALIAALEAQGKLGPDAPQRGIVEPTSGNTGLSLAAIAAAKGYRMRAVVPSKVPLAKKALLKMAGAELDIINDTLCPAPGLGDGSISIAKTHAKAQPNRYAMPNQYENAANTTAHERTTAPEIWKQTQGRVTHFFASLGTAGTIVGTGRELKRLNPRVRVVCIVPDEGHDVPGLRTPAQLASTNLFDPSVIDEVVEVPGRLAFTTAIELIRTEGILAGPSSGLIVEGARRVLSRDPASVASGVGVAILCDDAFKYVDSFLKHVPELAEGLES
jgi:cysteine synthase